MVKSKETPTMNQSEANSQIAADEKVEAKKQAQRRYQHTYDVKRNQKPRLSGYIEDHEEQMLRETVKLSPYESKKDVILAAVAVYKARLESDQPKNNLTITEDEIRAIGKLVERCSEVSGMIADDELAQDLDTVKHALKEICRRNDVI